MLCWHTSNSILFSFSKIHVVVIWDVTLCSLVGGCLLQVQFLHWRLKLHISPKTWYPPTWLHPETEHEWKSHIIFVLKPLWRLRWDENIIIKQMFRKLVLKIKWTRTWPSDGGLLRLTVLNKGHTGCIIKACNCLNLTALRCCLSWGVEWNDAKESCDIHCIYLP
jgi:hypothetical protein